MAIALTIECECGLMLSVYIPKAQIAAWMGDEELWAVVDALEEYDGEVDLVYRAAEEADDLFIDLRERDRCECGVPLNLEMIAEAVRSIDHPYGGSRG